MGSKEKLIEHPLSYKGYVGSVEISQDDNCLYGKVLDLPKDTYITYEGETVSELKRDFEGAIDDYLLYCEEHGLSPKKSFSGSLNIRISPEMHSKIVDFARKAGVSINTFVCKAINNQLATQC